MNIQIEVKEILIHFEVPRLFIGIDRLTTSTLYSLTFRMA